jgi:hypothetical protein
MARVTPFMIDREPSGHSYAQIGGIPAADEPYRAIYCWSLNGSAPLWRDDGTSSSRGST